MEFNELIQKHNIWRKNCINLVASENRMSPLSILALNSDMVGRYYFKKIFETETGLKYDYRGTKYIAEMYETTENLAKELFGASYVNLEMLSGHLANINILFSYCRPGDTIICSDTRYGGYPGLDADKLPKYLGLNVEFLPQSEIGGGIDIERLESLISETSPRLVMLSSSITITPFPVKEVSDLCHRYDIPFCYDASHPLGLIAGKQFQDPFSEGADIIIGSTHKSFPGPQGGIILGSEELFKVEEATDFVSVDNIHVNRVAALGVTLLEMKSFGESYAIQIIANAKALAKALETKGFTVEFKSIGYTQSHQFILRKDFGCYSKFTSDMENNGLILDNSGRVGVSEITRMGMKENDMTTVACFFEQVANNKFISTDVFDFMSSFQKVLYCFDD